MKRPEFSIEERWVIDYYKSRQSSSDLSDALWHELPAIFPTSVLVAWGMYQQIVWPAAIGFGILLALKIRELVTGVRWSRLFGSIFQKYDDVFSPGDAQQE